MIELSPPQFETVLALFDPNVPSSTNLFSVLEGRNRGRVFVDDGNDIRRAIAVTRHGFTFVGGEADQEFLDRAVARLRQETELKLVWPARNGSTLRPPPSQSGHVPRFHYYDRSPSVEMAEALRQLPGGTRISQTDAALLRRCLWRDMVIEAFGSTAAFVEHGVGFCLMKDSEILSEAVGLFHGAGHFNIGVITNAAHRGCGHASRVAAHLAEQCESKGIPTVWVCDQSNLGSARIAEKLGYKTKRPFEVLIYE